LPSGGYYHPYYGYIYNPALYWTAFGLATAARVFSYPWGYSRYDYGYGAPYYQGGYYYGGSGGGYASSGGSYASSGGSYAAAPAATTPAAAPQTPMEPPPTDTGTNHAWDDPHVANIEIRLSANATLWVLGQKVSTTGAVRHFYSPPLAEGDTYTYEFHARWTDANGKTVDRTKSLDVKAGSWLGVDFNQP
jgi:uncharacterized protein (TIGR03000 family)